MRHSTAIAFALALAATSAVAQTAPTAPAATARPKNKGLIGHSMDKDGQGGFYGMAGCGLGAVLFGETESRLGQILAATTNGLYGNQTFGMSSGTSQCVPEKGESSASVRRNMELFVVTNREALANDVVKSQGETILAVSEIMGCKDSEYLGAKLQSRYEQIFEPAAHADVAGRMVDTVLTDRYLFENCTFKQGPQA